MSDVPVDDQQHPDAEDGQPDGVGSVLVPGARHPRLIEVTVPFTAREIAHLEVAAAACGTSVEQVVYERAMGPTRP